MKHKHIFAIVALCCLLVGVVGYFATYPLMIGSPTEAEIKYWDDGQSCYRHVTVTGEQLTRLTDMLWQAKPTVFLHDHEGIGNEAVLMTLYYSDAEPREFSLWSFNSILYAGNAEDLSMSCMLGDWLHFGGYMLADIGEFLQ